jgi:peptide/nickel transport system ATP-binding protein
MSSTQGGEGVAVALLDVRNLVVSLDGDKGPRVLDDVSFSVERGEVLAIVGESGAGKSVTGAAIIGLLPTSMGITRGQILVAERRIDRLSAKEMRKVRGGLIGSIFQDPLTTLNPLFTIGQQLVDTIRAHLPVSAREARDRALARLEEVGIPAAAQRFDSYPHQFSGGMRQRVVIALALCAEPELIIADEPTTALDVSVQAQVIDLLKRLSQERGLAIVLITHDMGVVAEISDRVAVMYAGRIAEIGSTSNVINSPAHPYTRGLMDSIPPLGERIATLPQIVGTMPRLGALPGGCAFHPRCPYAFACCAVERPELLPAGTSQSACWRHDRVPGDTAASPGITVDA